MAATFGEEPVSFKQLTSGLSGFELCTARNAGHTPRSLVANFLRLEASANSTWCGRC